MSTMQADLVRGTIAEVKQLTVDKLKRILKNENLPVGGLKSELQTRLVAQIHDCDRRGDYERLSRIRDATRGYPIVATNSNLHFNAPNPYPSPYSNHTPASSASPQYYASPTPRLPPLPSLAMPGGGYHASRVTYKPSPFYSIIKQLGNMVELKVREQTRDTARMTIKLDATTAMQFQSDSNCRAMVFCAAESFDSTWKPTDIAFPSNSELRCNQEEVKVNLKGLKNKPGSTRPADITPFLRKKTEFPNNVELIYALTTKKYVLSVNLVQRKTIEMLVQALKSGKFLGKDRVVREMQNRAKDDDIIATSSNMSLKDPVQMTRIETPCRSISCKHNECFDAAVFLALQEQAPTWTCPICNRPAAWETLVFDQFVQDILDNTSSDTEQVTIEPDGRWHLIKHEEPSYNKNPFVKHNDSDDDDDLVEIADLEAPKSTATVRTRPSQDLVRTPSLNGFSPPPPRPVSASLMQPLNTSQVQSQSQGKKRAREEVIDLTLDDDDDEPPVSRIKRPSLASQVSADTNRLLDLTSGPGPGSGPFRFNLPPPVPRTDSPGHYSDYYDFDQLRKFQ